MSVVYRLWAATRLREVTRWQETWISPTQHGARSGHGTEDVFWALALKIESALISVTPLDGFNLDYSKCFDRLPRGIMLRVARELGMHEDVLRALGAMYSKLRSRFKCGSAVGVEYVSTNGTLQRCPLSLVLLNGLMSVWCRAMEEKVPDAEPSVFVDDARATASRPVFLNQALDLTMEFVDRTGQSLNAAKCSGFTTVTTCMKRLRLGTNRLEQTFEIRSVGATLATHADADLGFGSRVDDARVVGKRLLGVPLPFQARAQLLESLVLPRALYACEVMSLPRPALAKLNVDILKALLGGRRGRHCSEIVLSLLCPGHRLDAKSACVYKRLVTAKKMLDRRQDLRVAFVQAWRTPGASWKPIVGPLALIAEAFSEIGWRWVGPLDVVTETGARHKLVEVELPVWQYAVRKSMRMAAWRAAAARRDNLLGIEHGVNRDATMALLEGGRLGAEKDGILRTILADGLWTQERKHRANMRSSGRGQCPHCCEEAVEDQAHLWWHCSAWSHIRAGYPQARAALDGGIPPCFALCGVVPEGWYMEEAAGPEDVKQVYANSTGGTEGEELDSTHQSELPPTKWAEAAHRYGETWVQGSVVVCTDGAARCNQFRSPRFACVGAFWAEGHPFNVSAAPPGQEQTNNRAELAAVL